MDLIRGFTAPKTKTRKAADKAIVVRGGAGLSRRQLAALKSDGGAQFPPLRSLSFVTQPRDESRLAYGREIMSKVGPAGVASPYLRMVLNPFESEGRRYPDESIVPTGLVHLQTSSTYTVDASGAANGFWTYLNWKVTDAVASLHSTILSPIAIGSTPTFSDYGVPQASWRALDSIDRTLACAVRVRLMGLPTSTFVPSGTVYFLQYQPGEVGTGVDTEAECIQAVTARKGFSITLAEIARLGAVHLPFLPQGPMSYVFSASNSYAASGFPDNAASLINSPISPNGGLAVVAYGVQQNVVLRFDYSHHVEYIPKVGSAGLVETRVELPSSAAREFIATGTQNVLSVVAGGTSASDLAPLTSAARSKTLRGSTSPALNFSSGLSTLDSMLSTVSGLMGTAGKVGALMGGF